MGELNSMFTVTACSKGGGRWGGCMQRRRTERNRPLVASCSAARHGKEGEKEGGTNMLLLFLLFMVVIRPEYKKLDI